MKKIVTVILAAILSAATMLNAQSVGINADGSSPETSAMLDVKSTDKGFLAPRMTAAQKDAIATPATGLMIYQTDSTPGYYYYSGSAWLKLDAGLTSSQWTTSGTDIQYNNAGVVAIYGQSTAYNNTPYANYNGLVFQTYRELGVGSTVNIVATGSNSGNWDSRLAFHTRTNGGSVTEKMRISHDGKVGIGTSTPAAKLEVQGNIKVVDGTQGAGKVLTSDANGLASWVIPSAAATAEYSYCSLGATANTAQTISQNVGNGITVTNGTTINLKANKVYQITASLQLYNFDETQIYGYKLYNSTSLSYLGNTVYWGNPNGAGAKIGNYTTQSITAMIKPAVDTAIQLVRATGASGPALTGTLSVIEVK